MNQNSLEIYNNFLDYKNKVDKFIKEKDKELIDKGIEIRRLKQELQKTTEIKISKQNITSIQQAQELLKELKENEEQTSLKKKKKKIIHK